MVKGRQDVCLPWVSDCFCGTECQCIKLHPVMRNVSGGVGLQTCGACVIETATAMRSL